MAYQNIGTPRFFIDNYQYLRAMGLDPSNYYNMESLGRHRTTLDNPDAYTLDPINAKTFINEDDSQIMRFHIPCGNQVSKMDLSGNMKWYTAVLNHNFGSNNINLQNIMFMDEVGATAGLYDTDGNPSRVLNLESDGNSQDGSTIMYTDNIASDESRVFAGFQIHNQDTDDLLTDVGIGAISTGIMYTMPQSADLKLTMEIENDGYKSTTTSGGSTLTNINYLGSPNWVNQSKFINPFGIGEYSENQYLDGAKRNGRRNWTLKFSYISDKDLFSSNYMANNYTETTTDYDSNDIDTEGQFEFNIFTDDSFVAQVWNKTCGGALPFIFQPDSSNSNPDQFCLARFDQDTLQVKQVAYQIYDISIKITEVW